ncbi:Probable lipoprotein Cj1090c [hydrothermal vent metagenome]|uniref:Probable lipoprotein Cj1090c n=1 Tax=hydrothermal vent metagenome TaxID=652676 RepID=A0A1W1ELJ3_9ZZZZ
MGKNIFIDVIVDKIEPQSAVHIKDEMRKVIYSRFHSRVVSKEKADSKILISYGGANITPLSFDTNGFVTKYRINLKIKFRVNSKTKGNFTKTIHTTYESDIEESGKNQSTLRAEAIEKGLSSAVDEFVAYIATKGI